MTGVLNNNWLVGQLCSKVLQWACLVRGHWCCLCFICTLIKYSRVPTLCQTQSVRHWGYKSEWQSNLKKYRVFIFLWVHYKLSTCPPLPFPHTHFKKMRGWHFGFQAFLCSMFWKRARKHVIQKVYIQGDEGLWNRSQEVAESQSQEKGLGKRWHRRALNLEKHGG